MIPIKEYFTEQDRQVFYKGISKKALENLIKDRIVSPHIYGRIFIKKKLLIFFNGKCAFCETFEGTELKKEIRKKIEIEKALWSWQVEHYRPQAGVMGEKHTGYYWLGYECTNFLVACPICNGLQWKGYHFPIHLTSYRLTKDDFIENNILDIDKCNIGNAIFGKEIPMLLNPVIDKPKDFIQFYKDGRVKGKDKEQRGQISIDKYGLDRQQLRILRKKIVDDIKNNILHTVKAIRVNSKINKPQQAVFVGIIHECLKQLINEIRNPKTPFIAFRITVLDKFDEFVLNNEDKITQLPFVLDYKKELLDAYRILKMN